MRDTERKAWTEFVLKREQQAKKRRPRPKKDEPSREGLERALDDLVKEQKT
jgi:hypothetical protein